MYTYILYINVNVYMYSQGGGIEQEKGDGGEWGEEVRDRLRKRMGERKSE